MSLLSIATTEVLLQVAKQHPFANEGDQWSLSAFWARVGRIADKISGLDGDGTRNPIGLYMGLEIDDIAAALAIWLSGRTVVFLSSKRTPKLLQVVIERANVQLVLFCFSEPPAIPGVHAVSIISHVELQSPSGIATSPSLDDVVEVVQIGGESSSIHNPKLARAIFPDAAITNYTCTEISFAHILQTFVHPADPISHVEEDDHTVFGSATTVGDEVDFYVIETDSDVKTEYALMSTEAVVERRLGSSDEPVHEYSDPVEDPVYQFVVVDASDGESDDDQGVVSYRQPNQFIIVDASDSDSDSDRTRGHGYQQKRPSPIITSRHSGRQSLAKARRSPLFDFKSPSPSWSAFRFVFDDSVSDGYGSDGVFPVTPLLRLGEDSPHLSVFSPWIMPMRDQTRRRPSMLARAGWVRSV